MSVGFLFVFAAALLDHIVLFGIGALISLTALVAWFLPQRTERLAMQETSRADATDLPLAVAGPRANGYWGTMVLVLVLITALFTTVISALYLLPAHAPFPPGARAGADWRVSLTIVLSTIGGAVQLAWLTALLRRGRHSRGLFQLLIALIATATCLWLLVSIFQAGEFTPGSIAVDSAIVALLGFQGLAALILLGMLLAALAWAVLRPGDPRGHAVAWNSSLIAYFTAASAIVVVLAIHGIQSSW
jgi:hypothetical protein